VKIVSSEKTNKNISIEEKRLKAIKYALYAEKLLDPKYFDKATKAIAKKDKDAFFKIAKDAGIPNDVLNDFREDIEPLDLKMLDGWGGWGGWGGWA
jgi:predicted Ser/Thr protein kinase